MKKRFVSLLLWLLVAALVFSGCSQSNNSQGTTQGETAVEAASDSAPKLAANQVYTFSSGSEVTSMDPHKTGAIPVWAAQSPVYENLVRYTVLEDKSVSIAPGVATEWTESEDGLTWTFKLRQDAKWSDGTPLTAKDFVYTWQRVYDPATASDYEWMVDGMIVGGSEFNKGEGKKEDVGVRAIDEYTLEFKLNNRVTFFLQIVSFPTYKPVQQKAIEAFGDEYGTTIDKTVGNGPFMLSKWDQQEMVYVPNPYYWDKANVYLTQINRKIVKEENPRAQALIAGEIDAAGIAEAEWRAMLDGDPRFEYLNEAGANVEFYMFQLNNKYLSNKKIRQALSIAHDRERYVTEVGRDFGFAAYSVVPSVINCGTLPYTTLVNGENNHIKKLLADNPDPKALLIEGLKELGLPEDPSKVELTIQTRGTGESSKEAAEWLKQTYAEVLGINLKIEMTEWNIMWDNVTAGNYEIAVGGWGADLDDPSNLIDIFHTNPSKGYYHGEKTGWKGPQADAFNALVEKAQVTGDPAEKAKIYAEAEKILLDEAIISPIYFGEVSTYRAKKVKGLYSNSFTYLDYKGVYIEDQQ